MEMPSKRRFAPGVFGLTIALSMLVAGLAGVVGCGPAATAEPPTPTPPLAARIDIFRIVDLRELDADRCDAYNTHAVMHDSRSYEHGFWAVAAKTEEGKTVRFDVDGQCIAGKLLDTYFPQLPQQTAFLKSNRPVER